MGGQVLGGGVIVLVAVVLWLVYLLPTWHSRHAYDAAERNAVRLNQALRVLAETSETPQEVRLELNARTVLAQQKLARRAQAEHTELARRAQAEREHGNLEDARRALAAARCLPAARRARARRRARLTVSLTCIAAIGLALWGGWNLVVTGSPVLLWSSLGVAVIGVFLLVRMARVGTGVSAHTGADDVELRGSAPIQDVALPGGRGTTWEPRELPRPLTASAGSRASAVLEAASARGGTAVRGGTREGQGQSGSGTSRCRSTRLGWHARPQAGRPPWVLTPRSRRTCVPCSSVAPPAESVAPLAH